MILLLVVQRRILTTTKNSHYSSSLTTTTMPQRAYFQFVAQYSNVTRNNAWVTIIYTHRLPMAQTMEDYFVGLDQEVIAILLAREAVKALFFSSRNLKFQHHTSRSSRKCEDNRLIIIITRNSFSISESR